VPLTLLRLTTAHSHAIIEMGANHLKEIAFLCEIAQPTYGLITNVGKAHLEGFGSEDGVLQGKTELYRYLEKKKWTCLCR
jgi:UDP-N-acetylmuramoyl-tripeptide--D-alanyl-D-alanine ligase